MNAALDQYNKWKQEADKKADAHARRLETQMAELEKKRNSELVDLNSRMEKQRADHDKIQLQLNGTIS